MNLLGGGLGARSRPLYSLLTLKALARAQLKVGSRGLVTLKRSEVPVQPEQPVDPKSIEWSSLGFDYVPVKGTVAYDYAGSDWGEGRIQGPFVNIHLMSNVLHYGQAVFEGLKAFHQKDGTVALFNPKENAKRLKRGCERLGMPVVPEDMFIEALKNVVEENVDYVPPYGSGGSLYLRPVIFGHGAKLGLGKAPSYTFAVLASPVGNYYSKGLQAVDAKVIEGYDRAAPSGVGSVKCAGNYAADVVPAGQVASEGFPIGLYLDAQTKNYVEEFSTSNFVAISEDKSTYITPKSGSILPSITNIMLRQLAADRGLNVEERPIEFSEVKSFSEVAACGTAVIVTPIKSITKGGEKINISGEFSKLQELYQDVRDVQTGDKEDKYGWCMPVCKK